MRNQNDSLNSGALFSFKHTNRSNNGCRSIATRSLIQRSAPTRRPSTRSLPTSPLRPSMPAPLSTHVPPITNLNQFNPLDPNSLLLLPLAARLNPSSQSTYSPPPSSTSPVASSLTSATLQRINHSNRPFSRSVCTTGTSDTNRPSMTTTPSMTSQTGAHPLYTRTQSVCACCTEPKTNCSSPSGVAITSLPFTTCHCAVDSQSLQHRSSCSGGHLPSTVTNALQPAVQSATSASMLHTTLLALLLIDSLIGFSISKLRDPCDDPLYVSEASSFDSTSGGCSLIASLTFSSCLLGAALFALYVYFVHAIGQCDYNGFGARKRVLAEVCLTLCLALILLAATVLLLTQTAAVHTSAGILSAASAFIASFLLVIRAFLLKRELRMLDIRPVLVEASPALVAHSNEPAELEDDVFRS